MATPVNLQELMIERPASPQGPLLHRRRNAVARVILPIMLLGGLVAVLGWTMREIRWSAVPVTVVPVIANRAELSAADTPLFQTAGWVEPRPQATVVTALVEGVVDEIFVVEGQSVEAGQIVARLLRQDLEIALQRADADVRLSEAELTSAHAALIAAETLHAEPIHLLSTLADADTALAKIDTELARLPAIIRAAEAKRSFLELEVTGRTQAVNAVPAITLQKSKSDLEAATAQIDEHRQQEKSLERERLVLSRRRDVLARQLELKVDETQRLAESRAQVQIAGARLQQAQADRDAAQLRLERTDVRTRSAGHVLELVARPGSRLMGIDPGTANDASTVLLMYSPQNLQVRADVRLDDVPRVQVGQRVQIETPVSPQPIFGHVLMATATADMQKNTLQVKAGIDNPPAVLKPDMLVQVTFLTTAPAPADAASGAAPLRLWVPRDLVRDSGGDSTIWVADLVTGRARLQRITTGTKTADGLLEVTSGLNVGDRLIVGGRESLSDGANVEIRGTDPNLEQPDSGMAGIEPTQSTQSQQTSSHD